MDNETKLILEKLKFNNVICIPLNEIEDDQLLKVKLDRGIAEYCWTLSPCLPWYIFENYKYVDFLTYLDADLFFYSDVQPILDEIGESSIAIIEHRFTDRLKEREVNGRFCVEWVSFRRNEEGLSCLLRWKEQCIEWCYYRLEDGKMGDQKYLDEWPVRYSSCHIIEHLGAGVAPWNFPKYEFSEDFNNNIKVNSEKLIFYHFHQFQLLSNGKFDRLSNFYTLERDEPNNVYEKYENEIDKCVLTIKKIEPKFSSGIKSSTSILIRRIIQNFFPMWAKDFARSFFRY
jgi:hypothetical protein